MQEIGIRKPALSALLLAFAEVRRRKCCNNSKLTLAGFTLDWLRRGGDHLPAAR